MEIKEKKFKFYFCWALEIFFRAFLKIPMKGLSFIILTGKSQGDSFYFLLFMRSLFKILVCFFIFTNYFTSKAI